MNRRMILVALLVSLALTATGGAQPSAQPLGAGIHRVTFSVKAPADAETVHLAGTFNGWSKTATPMAGPDDHGRFTTTLELPGGTHEYKFIINGSRWMTDPTNTERTGPHDNAVLRLGPHPAATEATPWTPTMASLAPLPKPLNELINQAKELEPPAAHAHVRDWLAAHSMPIFSSDAVGFAQLGEPEATLSLEIRRHGLEQSHRMHQPIPDVPLYLLGLNRAEVPPSAVYLYRADSPHGPRTFIDPHAWSVTARNGQPAGMIRQPSSDHGRIILTEAIDDPTGRVRSRPLYVYLPPGYDATAARYPVIYMHDGQNAWDDPYEPFGHGGWFVNVTADRLIREGTIEPCIIVGVPNTPQRKEEYGPGKNVLTTKDQPYVQYLINVVKPAVDKKFRTKKRAPVMSSLGASLGGVISLQLAMLHPDVFGGAACLSPTLWYQGDAKNSYFDLPAHVGKLPIRLYLEQDEPGDAGSGDAQLARFTTALEEAGYQTDEDFVARVDPDGAHNERWWRERVGDALIFLLGTEKEKR